MDASRPFRVSDVLPATPAGASLARFLILARQAEHLRTAMRAIGKEQPKPPLEANLLLLGCYIGSLKELADAYRDLSTQGHLNWVLKAQDKLPDLAAAIVAANRNTDKADPDSLYSRFLKHVRDNAGFHVQRNAVESTLSSLEALSIPAATVTGQEQTIRSIPIVELMVTFLIWSRGADEAELAGTMNDSAALHEALRDVAYDLYLIQVRLATEGHDTAA